jgi:hypothetical protein
MAEQGLSKSEMARRMRTSRAALARLLDPDNDAVTLSTLQKRREPWAASSASSWSEDDRAWAAGSSG